MGGFFAGRFFMVGLCGPPKPSVKRLNPLDPQGLANFLDIFTYAISGPRRTGAMLRGVRTEVFDSYVSATQHQDDL